MAYLVWDPNRFIFSIPYLNHPITWYGLLFAAGFLLAFLTFRYWLRQEIKSRQEANYLTDKISWYLIIGTIIGARLVHVFFYDWPFYKNHLLEILAVWHGGLASHGGVLGILVALGLFRWRISKSQPSLTYLKLLDGLAVATPIMAACIRFGNFINQEIVGLPTTLPWGVLFVHPDDSVAAVPRHPVQLYECLFYLGLFALMLSLRRIKIRPRLLPNRLYERRRGGEIQDDRRGQGEDTLVRSEAMEFVAVASSEGRLDSNLGLNGFLSGLFLTLLFTFRFLIDYLKLPQEIGAQEGALHMGQILSIPFIILGLILMIRSSRRVKSA